MTYRLYNRPGSGGFAVEAALVLAGLPFELIELDSKAGMPLADEFRQTNPWGQVPVLIMPGGAVMTESAAILIHLAACHPEARLAPTPGTLAHGTLLRWMVFASVNLYEAVLRHGYPDRFTTDPSGYESIRAAAHRRMGEAVVVLEAGIVAGPFLLGKAMTVGDIYIAMLFSWFAGSAETPKLAELMARVRQNATIGPIWRRHFDSP